MITSLYFDGYGSFSTFDIELFTGGKEYRRGHGMTGRLSHCRVLSPVQGEARLRALEQSLLAKRTPDNDYIFLNNKDLFIYYEPPYNPGGWSHLTILIGDLPKRSS